MLLLDTHAYLWFLMDDPKLPASVKRLIESEETVCVSIGSFWEIAIKDSIGKLRIPAPVSTLVDECEKYRMSVLPIEAEHLALLKDLPRIHGDPFDRLLICQAKAENMILVTADENIVKYDVQVYWSPDDSD